MLRLRTLPHRPGPARALVVGGTVTSAVIATSAVLAAVLTAGAGGGDGGRSSASAGRQLADPQTAQATALTTDPATVSDGTSTFVVSAQPVASAIVVTANSLLWSAAPGQAFLVDDVTVQNPTSRPEPLSAFDDPASGLATDLDFVMPATDAAASGFSADCGADPGYPADVCPITFGEGLVVDSNSAAHAGTADETLAPGASAQISVSYGPVSGTVPAGKVSLSFHHGATAPVGL